MEKQIKKQFTPFDWVKQITCEKRDWDSFTDEEKESFVPFIINKALSYNKDYIQIVEMAMYYSMPPDKLYDFYKDVIPKKPIWNKWIKSQVNFDEQELQFISEYFECSIREAKDIVGLISENDKNVIIQELKGVENKSNKNGRKNVPK